VSGPTHYQLRTLKVTTDGTNGAALTG
jgi:hypothetical protein